MQIDENDYKLVQENRWFRFRFMILVLIFFSAMGFILMHGSVVAHESVHEQIGISFGCYTTNVTTGWLSGSYQCVERAWNQTPAEQIKEFELHALNEIVSYNIDVIVLAIVGCTTLLSFIIIVRTGGLTWKKKKKIKKE